MNGNKENKQFHITELSDKFFSQEKEKSYNVAHNVNNISNNNYYNVHNNHKHNNSSKFN